MNTEEGAENAQEKFYRSCAEKLNILDSDHGNGLTLTLNNSDGGWTRYTAIQLVDEDGAVVDSSVLVEEPDIVLGKVNEKSIIESHANSDNIKFFTEVIKRAGNLDPNHVSNAKHALADRAGEIAREMQATQSVLSPSESIATTK